MIRKAKVQERLVLEKQQADAETRLQVISASIKNLYRDKCSSELPPEVFRSLMAEFIKEQGGLEEKFSKLSRELLERSKHMAKVDQWMDIFIRYLNTT